MRVPSGTKLIFHRNDPFLQNHHAEDIENNVTSGTLNGTLNGTLKLNDRNQRVLKAIIANPSKTAEEIGDEINTSVRTVRRALKELQDQNLITRDGSKKAVAWTVRKQFPGTENDPFFHYYF